jgi:pentatricopeptide repeat protein
MNPLNNQNIKHSNGSRIANNQNDPTPRPSSCNWATIVKGQTSTILRPLRFCEFGGSSSGPDVEDHDAGCVPDTPKEGSFADGSLEWPSKFTKTKRVQYKTPEQGLRADAPEFFMKESPCIGTLQGLSADAPEFVMKEDSYKDTLTKMDTIVQKNLNPAPTYASKVIHGNNPSSGSSPKMKEQINSTSSQLEDKSPISNSKYKTGIIDLIFSITKSKKGPPSQQESMNCDFNIKNMKFKDALNTVNYEKFSADLYIYLSLLRKAPNEFAILIFKQMPDDKLDAHIYNFFISNCGKNGQFEEAQKTFYFVVEKGMANSFTYSSYIDACGKNGHFEEAKKTFSSAVEKGFEDPVIYTSYIDACGKNGHFEVAKKTFYSAVGKGLANSFTYSTYIDACGKNGEMEEAKKSFCAYAALDKAFESTVTNNSYINALGKNGQLDEAKKIFYVTVDKGLANSVTYHTFINILIQNGCLEESIEIFKKGNLKPLEKVGQLDLHDFSYGSGLVALVIYFQQNPNISGLKVITGKGCLEDGNYLSFRAELCNYIDQFLPELGYKFDKNDEGGFYLHRKG